MSSPNNSAIALYFSGLKLRITIGGWCVTLQVLLLRESSLAASRTLLLGMTPQEFYAKWDVQQEAIALICSRSVTTVRRWFARGESHRQPQPHDLRHLALMNFLLEHFEAIPPELRQHLCLPNL